MRTVQLGIMVCLLGLQAFGLILKSDMTNIDQIAEIRNKLRLTQFQIQTPDSVLGIQQIGADSFQVIAIYSRGIGKPVDIYEVTSEFSQSEIPDIVAKAKLAIKNSDYGKSGLKPAFNLTREVGTMAAFGATGGVVLSMGTVAASVALDVLTLPIQPVVWKLSDLKGQRERNQLADKVALESNDVLRVGSEEFFQMKAALTSVRPASNSIERICKEFYRGL